MDKNMKYSVNQYSLKSNTLVTQIPKYEFMALA